MKTLAAAVLLCAFVVYSQQDAKEEFAQHMKEHKESCIKATKVKPELTDAAMLGQFADDKELHCYVKCMFVKFGYMTEGGDINVDFMKKHPRPGVDEVKAAAAVEKCKGSTGPDACEKAVNMAKCIHAELKP